MSRNLHRTATVVHRRLLLSLRVYLVMTVVFAIVFLLEGRDV